MSAKAQFRTITADKIGSSASRMALGSDLTVRGDVVDTVSGDVVAVRALGESATYGDLELVNGRLARITAGDVIVGVLGTRRALKGFVGDVPDQVAQGTRLHILNLGGVIGHCTGHHSSLSNAIEVEVLGLVTDPSGKTLNTASGALQPAAMLKSGAPMVVIAGTCMNSGKTVAATEIIKQARQAGLKVAGAKLSGIAALRDTLNMTDHGAFATASFIDCGLPSTAEMGDLAPYAMSIINHLNSLQPDLIVAELGDGILGGYSVDSLLGDVEFREAISSLVFCAPDYVSVIGGISVLKGFDLTIDVVAGSVTDSQMGEDHIEQRIGLPAGNARRNGRRLFDLVYAPLRRTLLAA